MFVNEDQPEHNVTWVSGPKFKASPNLSTGQQFTLTLTQAVTLQYFCSIYPFMKGTITVTK